MREPSIYFSKLFYETIWPAFSMTLKNRKTKNDYFTLICNVCDYCKKDFLELSENDGNSFFHYLEEKNKKGELRKSTISIHLSKFNSLSNFIVGTGANYGISSFTNPFISVRGVEYDALLTKEHVPDMKEMDEILSMCKSDLQLYVAVALIVRCALSSSELCNIRRDKIIQDANGNTGILLNEHHKDRIIKIPSDIVTLIGQVIETYSSLDGTLFVNTRGKALSVRGLQRLYNKYVSFPDDKYFYTMSDIRNGAIAYYLSFDNINRNSVAEYASLSTGWLIRYNDVIPDLDSAPVDLVNIKIQPF